MQNIALYPGSFDPITFGHVDLVRRAVRLFDKVIVAVAVNTSKNPLFSIEERLSLAQKVFHDWSSVEVVSFEGLVVDYAKERGITILLRGVRMVSDFDYEFQMAITNRRLNPDIEVVFIMPSEEFFYISSQMIKEIVALGGKVEQFVPGCVEDAMIKKLRGKK